MFGVNENKVQDSGQLGTPPDSPERWRRLKKWKDNDACDVDDDVCKKNVDVCENIEFHFFFLDNGDVSVGHEGVCEYDDDFFWR